MRKNIWIIVSGVVCFSACRSVQAPQLIGGNKDEHGCLTAAGYTWSELRRDCIRIFEDGVRVDDPSLQPSLTVVCRVCGRQQPGGGFPSVSVPERDTRP